MKLKEKLLKLIENEIKELEAKDHARPNAYNGPDRYDSDEELRARTAGFEKYTKLKTLITCMQSNIKIEELSANIPDWIELLNEISQKEIKRLEENDYARPNAYNGPDRYDSDEELKARAAGFEEYSLLKEFITKLNTINKKVKLNELLDSEEGR